MFLRAAARRAASVAHVQRRTLLDKPNAVKQLREEFYADRAKGEFRECQRGLKGIGPRKWV